MYVYIYMRIFMCIYIYIYIYMCIDTHVYTYMFICPSTCETGGGGKGRRGSRPGPGPGRGRARMLSCNVPVWQKSGCCKAWFSGKWKVEDGVFFNYLAQFQKMKIANSTQLKMMKNCICKFSLSTENCRFSACMCTSEACTKKHEYRHFCSKRWFEKFMGLGRAFCFSWNWVWPAGNHNSKEQAHICCEFSCPD